VENFGKAENDLNSSNYAYILKILDQANGADDNWCFGGLPETYCKLLAFTSAAKN